MRVVVITIDVDEAAAAFREYGEQHTRALGVLVANRDRLPLDVEGAFLGALEGLAGAMDRITGAFLPGLLRLRREG